MHLAQPLTTIQRAARLSAGDLCGRSSASGASDHRRRIADSGAAPLNRKTVCRRNGTRQQLVIRDLHRERLLTAEPDDLLRIARRCGDLQDPAQVNRSLKMASQAIKNGVNRRRVVKTVADDTQTAQVLSTESV